MRGVLTDIIQNEATKLLGKSITETELRLMPYIQYVMVNSQELNRNTISRAERTLINKWIERKYIQRKEGKLIVTKKFWDTINTLIYMAYVDY